MCLLYILHSYFYHNRILILYYKQFHFSPYSYGRRLEEYTLNLRDSKYPFVTQPKKEIRELRNNKETAHNITKRTQNLLDDYDSHTSKQNFY